MIMQTWADLFGTVETNTTKEKIRLAIPTILLEMD